VKTLYTSDLHSPLELTRNTLAPEGFAGFCFSKIVSQNFPNFSTAALYPRCESLSVAYDYTPPQRTTAISTQTFPPSSLLRKVLLTSTQTFPPSTSPAGNRHKTLEPKLPYNSIHSVQNRRSTRPKQVNDKMVRHLQKEHPGQE
jgi:hypothetical protein